MHEKRRRMCNAFRKIKVDLPSELGLDFSNFRKATEKIADREALFNGAILFPVQRHFEAIPSDVVRCLLGFKEDRRDLDQFFILFAA